MYNKTLSFDETSSLKLRHTHELRTCFLKIIDIDIEQRNIKLLLHFCYNHRRSCVILITQTVQI